jgi:DNA polymerase I
MSQGALHTVFGWNIRIGENSNPGALRNFPMQANGAEMMRLACCLAAERGIEVCAPVHDALLICAPLERLEPTSQPPAPRWRKHPAWSCRASKSAPM